MLSEAAPPRHAIPSPQIAIHSFHQSREKVWRWQVQILRTNVHGMWILLALLPPISSVRGVTRLVTLVLALGIALSSASKVPSQQYQHQHQSQHRYRSA